MIDFLKYKWLYFLISAAVLTAGVFSLLRWGLVPSIDFTGGTIIEIKIQNSNPPAGKAGFKIQNLKEIFEKKIEVVSLQEKGGNFLLKTKPLKREKWGEIKKELEEKFGEIKEIRFETVGPVLGAELLKKTFFAALLAVLGILTYIAWAFKDWRYGAAAVLALLHDLLVLVGLFSLLGHFLQVEVDILFVTALLTTMSFSVHDTIVVFDRIRETVKEGETTSLAGVINKSLSETMTRSLNNSFTIIFMLLALVLLGGETLRWFATALLVGTISGTYSSPFVATPLLFLFLKASQDEP